MNLHSTGFTRGYIRSPHRGNKPSPQPQPYRGALGKLMRITNQSSPGDTHQPRPLVATCSVGDFEPRKRILLEALPEASGCNLLFMKLENSSAFLVDLPMACAIGADVPVVEKQPRGVLLIERDFATFGVTCYSDLLCQCTLAFGSDDLDGPDDPLLDDLAAAIMTTLSELREPQLAAMGSSSITLVGEGAKVKWLAQAMATRLALPVNAVIKTLHAALLGLRVYGENLDSFTTTDETPANSHAEKV